MVVLVAIAFYFLIARTATSRFHKLLMLQHLKRLRQKRIVLLQISLKLPGRLDVCGHGHEISSGLRAFCKEISVKIGARKQNFRISRRTFEYIV